MAKEKPKMVRVNLALTEGNKDFIETLSKMTGQSMTKYLNYVLDQYRTKNSKLYDMAKEMQAYIEQCNME